ncbi:hypothetical protein PICMEDRAFT_17066 [Pichia membranifaciens NRRL Y-2026]|uniref:Vacuolar sorting protein Vps3844 C-terminal domain-containing protein n=1 Tax=Pichia membranifaciens NRRL Y-2026 TaxID=763406 RepID=A0A1E3NI18_9ASCO|nr:hypothetical protein PICMEDRAFT_17066 [Pichia membranifaciens NRRL Y-2026]ODQ45795.1 hypothetical protein PICMEDRAFT_17066 [Pichia membranifaciens NRRL Y-2026]
MRFSALGTAIGGLAMAKCVAGIENAAVYKLKNNDCQSHGLTIGQTDATLNLAYDFGVSQFYNVEDVEDLNNVVLGNRKAEDGEEEKKLILIINGVEHPSDFFGSYDIAPTFDVEIKDDRHSSLLKSFLQDVPNKLYTLNKNSGYYLNKLSNEITILTDSNKKASYLKNLWNKYFHQEETNKVEGLWELLKDSVTLHPKAQKGENVLKINKRSMDYINDESFISELTQLEFFLNDELENNIKNDKVIINIDSLISIFKKTGVTQTYETCKNIISKVVIEKLQNHGDVSATIVVLPLDQSLVTVKGTEVFLKQQQHVSSLHRRSTESVFVKTSNACFANQLACIESTDSCSAHGLCTLVGSCWKCLCSATTDDKDRTSYWTGASCEKADYSSQFNLLLWTTIVLILSIVAGIKLMYQCGEQELPGVLLAATVQTKKAT